MLTRRRTSGLAMAKSNRQLLRIVGIVAVLATVSSVDRAWSAPIPSNTYQVIDLGQVSGPGINVNARALELPVRISNSGVTSFVAPQSVVLSGVPGSPTGFVTNQDASGKYQVGYIELGGGRTQSFVTENGTTRLVTDLGGITLSDSAWGVNAQGSFVGDVNYQAGGGGLQQTRTYYIKPGPATGLPGDTIILPPTGPGSLAFGLNDINQVVGSLQRGGATHAFALSDVSNSAIDLNDLIKSNVWVFNVGTDINNGGNIVGYGTNIATGNVHALLLQVVPEPATWIMMLMAGAFGGVVSRNRRRRAAEASNVA